MTKQLLWSTIICSSLLSSCSFPAKDLTNTPEFHALKPIVAPIPEFSFDENRDYKTSYSPLVQCPTSECIIFPYDNLLWHFGKHVGFKTEKINGKRDLLFLDTGLYGYTRVPLDIVFRRDLPIQVRSGENNNIVHFNKISIGDLEFKDIFATTENKVYSLNAFGTPIYKYRVITMGTPDLRSFKYLILDNPRKRAIFGMDNEFNPDPKYKWEVFNTKKQYIEKGNYYLDRPMIDIKLNGQSFEMLHDSGGGLTFVFSRKDWDRLKKHVDVISESPGLYPDWGGTQDVDVYEIASLKVGNREFTNIDVWVRRNEQETSIISLGTYSQNIVVYDFQNNKIWTSY